MTSQGSRKEIVPMVINGGCDIFLFSLDDDYDFSILVKAVEDGTIPSSRVEDAVLRVLALKASLGLHRKKEQNRLVPAEEEAEAVLGCAEHKGWSEEVVSSSITLVKDTQNLLPVTAKSHRRILLIQSEPVAFLGPPEEIRFRDYLEQAGFEVTTMEKDKIPSPDYHDLVIYLLNQFRFFGNGSYFADWPELHKGLLKSMIRTWDDIPTMMISLSNPYHLFDAPRVRTYINAYSPIESVFKQTGEDDYRGGTL